MPPGGRVRHPKPGAWLLRSGMGRAGPAWAVVAGGLAMAGLVVPFTLTHGPTSYNEERVLLGADMHRWGLLLGVVPNLLIVAGLWASRRRLAGGRRAALAGVTVVCVALTGSAALDLGFGALGAPFALFALVPALLIAAATAPREAVRGARTALAVLDTVLALALAVALVPQDVSDAHGLFRVFCLLAYGAAGLAWAGLGLTLSRGSATAPDHR